MAAPKGSIRVLVVDCNVDAAEILGILLGAYGFDVRVECGKAAALKAAESFLPHAVLIDLGQDKPDTYELAAGLRAMPQLGDVYVITISDGGLPPAHPMSTIRIDARLTKPAAYRMLVGTLERRFGV